VVGDILLRTFVDMSGALEFRSVPVNVVSWFIAQGIEVPLPDTA
jgi:hypothetical protein